MSVIDLLKGSDGHVYKGRFRQVWMYVYSQHKFSANQGKSDTTD